MSMMLPVFLGSVDQSILASSLPTIGRDLGDMHNLPWLITGFLISATALTPLYGKFADIHGRRASLLIALGVYMVGSLISASSNSMLMLICGRIVQGCGGGGMTTSATMVLGDVAAPKDRAKYYVYFSIAFTTAGGCGPALGGWICDHLHWSVIFLWNFPLCVLAVIFALTLLRRLPRYERPHRLDVIGAVLVMAASSSFMLALNLGGARYPWLSAPVLALFCCAVVLGVGFVFRLLTAVEPLIPIVILADRAARLVMLANCFGWGAIIGLNIFLPMYLQRALGWSATASGLSLMILMVSLNASAGLSSQLIGRVKHYKLVPTVCLVIGISAVLALPFSISHMTSLQIRDHPVPDRRRFRSDAAAHSSRATEHRTRPSPRHGDRHDEFHTHACRHNHCGGIRRDRPCRNPNRRLGGCRKPCSTGSNVRGRLRLRIFWCRVCFGGRICGAAFARGEAAARDASILPALSTWHGCETSGRRACGSAADIELTPAMSFKHVILLQWLQRRPAKRRAMLDTS